MRGSYFFIYFATYFSPPLKAAASRPGRVGIYLINNDMKERLFRFKQFSVHHSRSAMKVGVDGVLLGAWCDVAGARRIVDVGAGCGLIALMAAQRNPDASVIAVEIDPDAADEAALNASQSPWNERVEVVCEDIVAHPEICCDADLIVSNPPFFDSGVSEITTNRELARHCSSLSPMTLIDIAAEQLSPHGLLAMIFPADHLDAITAHAAAKSLTPKRICYVRGHAEAPVKRVLAEYSRTAESPETEHLTLETSPGVPTDPYRRLCHDFYLKF